MPHVLKWCCVVLMPGLLLLSSPAYSDDAQLATATAEAKAMPEVYVADARIEAVHQATLAAETTGRIQQILFDVDDVVSEGRVLLRFTDKEQRANVAKAEAGLKEAQARLNQARDEQTRVQSMFDRKLVAKSALDNASADFNAAQQRVKAAEAELKKAREQLEYTVVRAPYAGIVVERHVNVGERVNPGTPLMTGFSLKKLRAVATVPQSMVEQIRRNTQATISNVTTTEPVQVVSQDITVYPYADKVTHSFTVRAELAAVPEGFYPGMFVKAAFVIGEKTRLLVPASAVVHRSEVTAVYVVDAQNRVQFRAVRVGNRVNDHIEILAGLMAGEQVATDPVAAGSVLKQQRTGG